ncbi:MAG: hypothetical protein LBQ97_06030 [Fusobacteriaceae bacterium]|jgi:hypothetical protein|nr:hypothetical protein [Fusobacteriaceae bacterium]
MKIFIAGARQIKFLDDAVKEKLESIRSKNYDVLIGDAPGVDSLVQSFYASVGYPNVTIFACNGKTRNNIGVWPVEGIPANRDLKSAEYFAQKDIAMTAATDYGFMIWNGQSRGTMNNILRLLQAGKSSVVYLNGEFYSVYNDDSLQRLFANCLKLTPKPTEVTFVKQPVLF